ncbi:uncharacterized protein LOC111038708 [Myzus persicae]|uniref:uncharacterized protein LOC111038708 n=1 Tax=Myzus persicae TaxID=13164 RepID=UPI000B933342|nr:uncharacterized protein LOC111038708 [Myzus persicae]
MVTTCSVKGCKSRAGQGIKFHRLPKGEIREAWVTFLKKYNPLFVPTSRCITVCGLHFLSDLDYEITPTSAYLTKRLKKNSIPSIMNQNIRRSLFNKSNKESNCIPDHDAEEVVTLSPSDLYAELPVVPPSIPLPVDTLIKNIVLPKATVQSASTISPLPTIQNRNEIPSVLVQGKDGEKLLRPNNKRKCFMGDFKHPSDIDSPNNRLKYWIASQSTVNKQNKQIKFLYRQTVDLRKKIKKLDNLLHQLKNEKKNVPKELILSSSQHEIYMSMCKPI